MRCPRRGLLEDFYGLGDFSIKGLMVSQEAGTLLPPGSFLGFAGNFPWFPGRLTTAKISNFAVLWVALVTVLREGKGGDGKAELSDAERQGKSRNALAYIPAASPSAAKRHPGTGIARRSPHSFLGGGFLGDIMGSR
jgi:hypothetical protein